MALWRQSTGLALAFAISSLLASGQGEDPSALARQASTAMKSGRFETAERIYRDLVREFPAEPGLGLNLALAQYSSGKFEEALKHFRRFLEAHPDHAPAWLLVGVSHQKLDRPAEAVQPLQRAVKLDPGNRIAKLELADAFLRSGKPDRAASAFLELARIEGSNPKAWLGLGLSYTELSRSAAETLERTAPRSAHHQLLLAHSAQAQRRYRAAFRHYRAALAVDPASPGAHEAVAEIYREIGRSDWADTELAKVPRKAPCADRKMECWFEAGNMDGILSDSESKSTAEFLYWRARALGAMAREAHQQLLSLPPSAAGFRLLASIEDLNGRASDAAAAWRRAVEMEPADTALRRGMLRSLNAAGMYQESIREAEALLQLRPKSAVGRFYLGDAMLELGRVDEAIPVLEAAARIDAADNRIRVSLATAYLRAGRGADAIPHLEAALRGGDDERLLFQLSRAYQLAGRPDEARAALERRRTALAGRGALPTADEITPP